MPDSTQRAFGGAIAAPGTERDLLRQQEVLTVQRNLPIDDPGPVRLDPLSDEAMEIFTSWQPKEQGKMRSTCVAFSVLAMAELYERLVTGGDEMPDYSEEFLYSKMRRKHARCPLPPNYEDGSSFMQQAGDALEKWGVCSTRLMPYELRTSIADYLEFPSTPVKENAARRQFPEHYFTYLRLYLDDCEQANGKEAWKNEKLAERIRSELQSGNPVAAAFPIYRGDNQWTHPASTGWRRGNIGDPDKYAHVVDAFADNEIGKKPIIGGHAVCIVGFREGQDGRDGRFLFRNSWGKRFAAEFRDLNDDDLLRLPGAGYGTISAAHVENHCWELLFRNRANEKGLHTH